ncbi:hypothetical protein F3J45_08450 [Pantoea sp. Ap-967]|uniref:hypothetical protein n=1 Tax=Pantoea sp. Ap-967 TaxID=2608362 RepID=UPI00141ED23B|nr:hypothetical protein [Pantoea sp. Ap-967]NIE74462.1 hypothetical protein [Pantoea sp. Ap-967]
MNITQYSLKLLRELPPQKQAKTLLLTGILLLSLGSNFILMQDVHETSDEASWSRVSASLTSQPEIWKSDKSLYTFGIKFQSADGVHAKTYLYAQKARFEAANLERSTPLLVDIANTEKGSIAERLIAPNGMVLYDPALAAYVTNVRNRETARAVIIFTGAGIGLLIGAAVIYCELRIRGH